jgi:hypothetical protein
VTIVPGFDAAWARYDKECQDAEDYDEAFHRYCEDFDRDPEDPESLIWWDARLQQMREEYEGP